MAIGNPVTLTSNVASKTVSSIATAGQTLFTVSGGYRLNYLSVFRNGTKLVESLDFIARDGNTVTLLSPSTVGDVLEFEIFDTFRAADAPNTNDDNVVFAGTVNIQRNLNVVGLATITSSILNQCSFKNYAEVTSDLGNTGTAKTINLVDGNVFTATLTGNCAFTFTTGLTSGTISFTLILTNDSTAGRSIVWPVTVKWPNNVTPQRTTAANATDVWSFFTPNNGATWYGNISLYNFT